MDGPSARLFVGGLPPDVHTRELEDVFAPFGRIRDIHVPQQRPRNMGGRGGIFAFVEFDDPRAAQEASRARDGFRFGDMYLRVEVAKGRPTTKRDWPGPPGAGGAGGRAGRQRSEHRVLVEGIPPGTSWQTLKDFVRAGVRDLHPNDFFNVERDGRGALVGVVEFAHHEAMLDAIRALDNTDFRDRSGQASVVRVVEEAAAQGGARGRSMSRSRSRSRGRSRSWSPRGGARYGRSRSRSPRRRRSCSPRRSRSRSPLPRSRSRSPPAERELPREPEQEKAEPEKAEPEKAEPEKAEPQQ